MNLGQTECIHPLKFFRSEWSPSPLPPATKHKWSQLTVTKASWESSFCQVSLFLIPLGRDFTGFSPLIKTISPFKIYLSYYNYILFIISGESRSGYLYLFILWHMPFIFFRILHFIATAGTKKQDVLSIDSTFLEFLFGQKCKSVDPSKLSSFWQEKQIQKRIFWDLINYFPLSCGFVFVVVLFLLNIQLLSFCLLFTYFKIKIWNSFSYFSRSFIWLERYFWAMQLKS